jgi:hypothetical protein
MPQITSGKLEVALLGDLIMVICRRSEELVTGTMSEQNEDPLMEMCTKLLNNRATIAIQINSYGINLKLQSYHTFQQWILDWLLSAMSIETIMFDVTFLHIWEARHGTGIDEPMLHSKRESEKIKVLWI